MRAPRTPIACSVPASEPRRITESGLGAWLIKGNADNSPLAERFAADPHVGRWCVQRNYRSD